MKNIKYFEINDGKYVIISIVEDGIIIIAYANSFAEKDSILELLKTKEDINYLSDLRFKDICIHMSTINSIWLDELFAHEKYTEVLEYIKELRKEEEIKEYEN